MGRRTPSAQSSNIRASPASLSSARALSRRRSTQKPPPRGSASKPEAARRTSSWSWGTQNSTRSSRTWSPPATVARESVASPVPSSLAWATCTRSFVTPSRVPPRRPGREHRHQRRGRGPDGLLPVRRDEELVLRGPPSAESGCDPVLHGEQGRHHPMAMTAVGPRSAASRLWGFPADAERDPAEEAALLHPSVSLCRWIERIRCRDGDPKSRLGSRLRQRVELLGTVLAVVRDQSGVRPLTRLRLDAIRIGDATGRANEVDASLEPLPPSKGEDRIEPVGSEFFQAADLLRAARIDHLGGAEPSDEGGGLWDGCRPKHVGAPERCELHGEGTDSPRRPEDQDGLAPAQMQCIVDPLERR